MNRDRWVAVLGSKRAVVLALAVGVALAAGLTSCEKYEESYRDAPRSGNVNDDPADTITYPDGFSNVAVKCDGPNRVYVLFHSDGAYGAVDVVANDLRCGGVAPK